MLYMGCICLCVCRASSYGRRERHFLVICLFLPPPPMLLWRARNSQWKEYRHSPLSKLDILAYALRISECHISVVYNINKAGGGCWGHSSKTSGCSEWNTRQPSTVTLWANAWYSGEMKKTASWLQKALKPPCKNGAVFEPGVGVFETLDTHYRHIRRPLTKACIERH